MKKRTLAVVPRTTRRSSSRRRRSFVNRALRVALLVNTALAFGNVAVGYKMPWAIVGCLSLISLGTLIWGDWERRPRRR